MLLESRKPPMRGEALPTAGRKLKRGNGRTIPKRWNPAYPGS
jgi:hypothetical protein